MSRIFRTYFYIKILIDEFVIFFTFWATSIYFNPHTGINVFGASDYFLLFFLLFFWFIISKILPIYDDPGIRYFSLELTILVKAIIAQCIAISLIMFFIDEKRYDSRAFVCIYVVFSSVLLIIEKYALHFILKKIGVKGENIKKVLIVGAGQLGMAFYDKIVKEKKFGYQLVGFVDDEKKSYLNGEYLGKIDALEQIIEKNDIEEVIIALPNKQSDKIEKAILFSEKKSKRVRIIPDYYRFGSGNFRISSLGTFPLINVRSLPLDNLENRIVKRLLDLFFSVFFIVFFFSWILPIIVILIKINSKGPVFFIQERWGLNNKKIVCFKFRTMKMEGSDTLSNQKYRQATKNDFRVTSVGKFLRKTSLDELPQLLNVFLGNMSFVGPRPHPIPLNLESRDRIRDYMLRHLVKPGITGWAQVNGARGETDTLDKMQKRINFDIWYIENWNVWLDFEIIAQTAIKLIKGDSLAY